MPEAAYTTPEEHFRRAFGNVNSYRFAPARVAELMGDPGAKGVVDECVEDSRRFFFSCDGKDFQRFFHWDILLLRRRYISYQLVYYEQFGPVIPVVPFNDVKEPLKYVVESNFGQQVSVFGKDPDTIAAMTDTLVNQVSRVNINSQCQRGPDIFPFTGRKDSAEGTLSVSDALRVFSIRALVAAKESDANKKLVRGILRGRKSKFLSTDFIL